MNTIECITTRRSVRNYSDRAVDPEIIRKAVEAAAFAPSWKNTQVTRYTVVTDPELKARIAEECCGEHNNARVIKEAPVLIGLSMVEKRSGYERDGSFSTTKEKGWQMFDCGIACQTLCLALHDAGVDSLIMGIFDIEKATELLKIPEGQEIAALLAVGYRAEDANIVAPPRKTVDVLLTNL